MHEQTDLPFQKHSPTSREAAQGARPVAGLLRENVLAFIRSRGEEGATDQEIQEALALDPSTQRPRRVELVQAGLVWNSGKTRKTRSGREAVVWVISTSAKDKGGS